MTNVHTVRGQSSGPLEYLFSLEQFGIKLGLDNITLLTRRLGRPDRSFRSIIVAGTNGKGSVAAMLDTALRASGYSTGRFTSPHLVDLEERFALDGIPVSREALETEAARLQQLIETCLNEGQLQAPPTFFEATTAIALSLFRQAAIDIAVLEVGMGGRFDATNVVTPIAAAIPSIDLDHQKHLGTTLEAIAFEKAGVIKPGMLVVTAETKQEPLEVLRRVCDERGARLIETHDGCETKVSLHEGRTQLELQTPTHRYGPLQLGLRGRHQVRNAMVVAALLEQLSSCDLPVPPRAVRAGLTNTEWSGRLELRQVDDDRSLVLDAAHNVASISAFADYVHEVWPAGLPIVFGAVRDKDVAGMARALGPAASALICPPLMNHRALSPEALVRTLRAVRPDLDSVEVPSLRAALELAWARGGLVGATGSIFLIGELVQQLELRV